MKKARARWSAGVRRPRVNATEAGATPKDICGKGGQKKMIPGSVRVPEIPEGKKNGEVTIVGRTRSANESNSWPMSEAFCLQRATLPSMKSKRRPSGMKARAR